VPKYVETRQKKTKRLNRQEFLYELRAGNAARREALKEMRKDNEQHSALFPESQYRDVDPEDED